MELKKFGKVNNIVAVVVLAVASFTYLATIEPTASFWDCGEFIASSYKLEIGHPPGNPVFQVIARMFTLFGNKDTAAVLVNSMSALCSAFTIFFLYLTIIHLARRLFEKSKILAVGGEIPVAEAVKIYAAGLVGALAYCWSDTFWFSAVEGEVYAMSSLFTAVVFWAMLKWEEQADSPYANRWIVLIAFLMGLSIGVHLLNLLAIPAIVLLYYFKKYKATTWGAVKAFLLSCVILSVILWGIIPYVPTMAAYVDMFFVNSLGLAVNSGATVFALLLLAACFGGVYLTYKRRKYLANLAFLCLSAILIGYSVFAVVIIRSSQNPPTNEYQPDNPFTLVRYLSREQYGSSPLLYGQTFATSVEKIDTPTYYNVMNGKYKKLNGPADPVYASRGKMFFPRMYATSSDNTYEEFYKLYTNGEGRGEDNIPTVGANLKYFFDYQVSFMYLRYFMWNFVGRQNDLHATMPGDIYKGNWESGVGFIDKARLGEQSQGPAYIVDSKAKNHFYFLPLILGLIGLFYQWSRDKRNFLVTFLLFFLTGLAIVLYLNQPPFQARERDYAYAGSFYIFTIWIGFAVLWLGGLFEKMFSKGKAPEAKKRLIASVVAGFVALLVPVQMVSQTWDDHDRSGRTTSVDMAYNFLSGLDKNAILVTHGDNDTFPLWYAQEVEGIRTDVRVVNTSLLGIDWYIDQLQWKQYESEPLNITLTKDQYYYGKNDFVPVLDIVKEPVSAVAMLDAFKDPKLTVKLTDGQSHSVIAGHKMFIPVNKENVKKWGIVKPKDYDKIADTLLLTIPSGVQHISKTDLIILDIIAHYNWDRPLYFLNRGGDVNIGEKEYLQYEGFAYKFVPIKSRTGVEAENLEQADTEGLYNNLMNTYKLNSLAADVTIDYQNLLTFTSTVLVRNVMANCAKLLLNQGDTTKAVAVLDKMQAVMPSKNFPLNCCLISSNTDLAVMDAIQLYLHSGQKEKGLKLGSEFVEQTRQHIALFSQPYYGELISWEQLRRNIYYLLMVADIYRAEGATSEAKELALQTDKYVKAFNASMSQEPDTEEIEDTI